MQTIPLRRVHVPHLHSKPRRCVSVTSIEEPPLPIDYQSKETMYRYLLGRCSKKEQLEFEASYLRDGKLFDKLMELEAAVIAAYHRGELSREDRADIEKHILANRRFPRRKPSR